MTNEEVIKHLEFLKIAKQIDATPKDINVEALNFAIKAIEENAALNLLVDWAIQCDFGYYNFPEKYEKYAEEIEDLGYKEGMVYIAKKEAINDEVD